ncbi:MAG: hypothetical protein CML06_18630 [Pseudomonadales bacterium]|nr:hypothetical protein [Pseudomonadales bacterium]
MKNRMLAIASLALMVTPVMAQDTAATAADGVFRSGVAYCNQASKLSRADTAAAREQFNRYLSHLEQARVIQPGLLETNSFAAREHRRCQLVEDNIARAEAMPLVEEGLARCNAARDALERADLNTANAAFEQFQQQRDQALAITPTVLRVGSVGVRLRVCDRLVEKIALAQAQQQLQQQRRDRAQAAYSTALASCDAGRELAAASSPTTNGIKAVAGVVQRLAVAQNEAEKLAAGSGRGAALSLAQGRFNQCQAQLMATLERLQQAQRLALAQAASAREAAEAVATPMANGGPVDAMADAASAAEAPRAADRARPGPAAPAAASQDSAVTTVSGTENADSVAVLPAAAGSILRGGEVVQVADPSL